VNISVVAVGLAPTPVFVVALDVVDTDTPTSTVVEPTDKGEATCKVDEVVTDTCSEVAEDTITCEVDEVVTDTCAEVAEDIIIAVVMAVVVSEVVVLDVVVLDVVVSDSGSAVGMLVVLTTRLVIVGLGLAEVENETTPGAVTDGTICKAVGGS